MGFPIHSQPLAPAHIHSRSSLASPTSPASRVTAFARRRGCSKLGHDDHAAGCPTNCWAALSARRHGCARQVRDSRPCSMCVRVVLSTRRDKVDSGTLAMEARWSLHTPHAVAVCKRGHAAVIKRRRASVVRTCVFLARLATHDLPTAQSHGHSSLCPPSHPRKLLTMRRRRVAPGWLMLFHLLGDAVRRVLRR